MFAGFRIPREVISVAVRWYLRYNLNLSYRDAEGLLAERGITVDHVTIYRWVQRFTLEFIRMAELTSRPQALSLETTRARARKRATSGPSPTRLAHTTARASFWDAAVTVITWERLEQRLGQVRGGGAAPGQQEWSG